MLGFPWSRRKLIKSVPTGLTAALLHRPAFAQVFEPLRFIVIGDWGRRGNRDQRRTAELAKQLAAHGNDFTVTTGDNFYTYGVKGKDDPHWHESYEDVYSDALKRYWLAALGNHDYGGNVEAQIAYRSTEWHGDRTGNGPWGWRMDDRWWDTDLRAFGREDVHLFFVDTVTWLGKEKFPFNLGGSKVRVGDQDKQRKCLDEKMQASNAKFKLVIGHHGIYSIGKHGGSMQLKELDDLIRSRGVTAYINGHDHCLYHIRQNGLDYVCSGAGSEFLEAYTGGPTRGCTLKDSCPNPDAPEPHLPIWYSFIPLGGITQFTVYQDRLEFQFFTTDGKRTSPVSIAPR